MGAELLFSPSCFVFFFASFSCFFFFFFFSPLALERDAVGSNGAQNNPRLSWVFIEEEWARSIEVCLPLGKCSSEWWKSYTCRMERSNSFVLVTSRVERGS